jgi:ubiquinone/menaquinone biosynthesis C-methylase UbiE
VKSPWLDIPLADYEAHMALPGVGQAQLLADLLEDALRRHAPASVAVLGCAGGNGLDRVSNDVTGRVVGVDLNPDYIREARERFGHRIPRLELHAGDVESGVFDFAPVDLAFAGLLFEYVDPGRALANVRGMIVPGGALIAVVQLPSAAIPEITPSPVRSLEALSSVMHLVPPEILARRAAEQGYRETESRTVAATGGKEFRVQTFRR